MLTTESMPDQKFSADEWMDDWNDIVSAVQWQTGGYQLW